MKMIILTVALLLVPSANAADNLASKETVYAYAHRNNALNGGVEIIVDDSTKVAGTCFFKGEQISGLNKICFYDCVGSTVAINISATSICPLSINR